MHKTVEAYVIQIDLPGVAPETDLSVKTDGNKLVIKVSPSFSLPPSFAPQAQWVG
jgi:HSP20 family molecular chaperone IbpA